jgi:peptide/nickel transport system substrate-binding protein
MKFSRMGLEIVAIGAIALVITGCAGAAEPSAKTALNLPLSDDLSNISPLTAIQQGKGQILSLLGLPILQTDQDGKIISQVLESWDISDDATVVTLKVVEGLKWSDGEPITAEDVNTTLNIYLDASISANAGRIGGVLGQDELADGTADSLSGVEIVDASTVVVTLEQANVAWAANVATAAVYLPLLPDHVLGGIPHVDLPEQEYFSTYSVSSGPYSLVKYTDGQGADFKANPEWSLTDLQFTDVFLRIAASDTTLARLQTGEFDFAFPIDPTDIPSLGSIEGISIQSQTGVAPELLGLNYADPLLADPRVRQAMIYAIDRATICQEVLYGYCETPLTNVRQVSPAWALPTEDVIEYAYDPEKARELLAEAGWDSSSELTLLTRSGISYVDRAITIAQAQLAEVGINFTLRNVDVATLLELFEVNDGSWQAFWVSGANFSVDPSAMATYASCDSRYPAGGNTSQYCDPETDALWGPGLAATDPEERAAIYQEIFRRMNQDPAEVYLYVVDTIAAFPKELTGVKLHGELSQPYWNIADWGWATS